MPPPAACSIATTVGETLLLTDAGEQLTLLPREIRVKPGALALTIDRPPSSSTGSTHGSCNRPLGTRRRPQSCPSSAGDRRLRRLEPAAQEALRDVLLDMQQDARERAEKSWRTHKPPLAAYWSAVGVYAGHIARCLNRSRPRSRPRTAAAPLCSGSSRA